jgi:hypothetical protein
MRRLTAAATTLLLLAACRERGRPDPNIRMAISHERVGDAAPASEPPQGENAIPTRLEVPPEVVQAWSGIRIGWKDKSSGKEGVIDVPLGGGTPLPDPTIVVRADVFLPAFTMGGGAITSEGVEPQNPAARIAVFEKGKEIFAGWIFTRFPDVHPFTHPRFQLRLEGGVPKAAK